MNASIPRAMRWVSDVNMCYRTGLVLGTRLPVPSFFPEVHTVINDYLAFDLNWSALWAIVSLLYYYILEPTAAVRLLFPHSFLQCWP